MRLQFATDCLRQSGVAVTLKSLHGHRNQTRMIAECVGVFTVYVRGVEWSGEAMLLSCNMLRYSLSSQIPDWQEAQFRLSNPTPLPPPAHTHTSRDAASLTTYRSGCNIPPAVAIATASGLFSPWSLARCGRKACCLADSHVQIQ